MDEQLVIQQIKELAEDIAIIKKILNERLPKKRKATTSVKGKRKYGEYKHVLLTDEEHADLLAKYGEDALDYGIKVLDDYIEQSGKSYKGHHFMLDKKWPAERIAEYKKGHAKAKQERSCWQ